MKVTSMHPELVHLLANQRHAELLEHRGRPRKAPRRAGRGRVRTTVGGWLITAGVRLSLSPAAARQLGRGQAQI